MDDCATLADLKIPGVEVGYRLKIGTEDDSSSAYHSRTICTRLTFSNPTTHNTGTTLLHSTQQENEQGSQPTHGALLSPEDRDAGNRATHGTSRQRRLPYLGIPPATLRGQGTLLHRPVLSPNRPGPPLPLLGITYTGQQIVGQLSSNAVHHPMDTRAVCPTQLWAAVGGVPPSSPRQSVVGAEVGRG